MLLTAMVGCSQFRNNAVAAFEISEKTDDTVVANMYKIGVAQAMAFAKAQINAEAKAGTLTPTRTNEIINKFSQALVDLGWQCTAHAQANGMHDIGMIFVLSRQTYIELLMKELEATAAAQRTNKALISTTTKQAD